MLMVYVVLWRYSDGSASGAVCALWSKSAADRMLKLLESHGDSMKRYEIEAIPCDDLP